MTFKFGTFVRFIDLVLYIEYKSEAAKIAKFMHKIGCGSDFADRFTQTIKSLSETLADFNLVPGHFID